MRTLSIKLSIPTQRRKENLTEQIETNPPSKNPMGAPKTSRHLANWHHAQNTTQPTIVNDHTRTQALHPQILPSKHPPLPPSPLPIPRKSHQHAQAPSTSAFRRISLNQTRRQAPKLAPAAVATVKSAQLSAGRESLRMPFLTEEVGMRVISLCAGRESRSGPQTIACMNECTSFFP